MDETLQFSLSFGFVQINLTDASWFSSLLSLGKRLEDENKILVGSRAAASISSSFFPFAAAFLGDQMIGL